MGKGLRQRSVIPESDPAAHSNLGLASVQCKLRGKSPELGGSRDLAWCTNQLCNLDDEAQERYS